MKTYKIYLVELSTARDDGSRETIKKETVCTCPAPGNMYLIFNYLRDHVYGNILNAGSAGKNDHIFQLCHD